MSRTLAVAFLVVAACSNKGSTTPAADAAAPLVDGKVADASGLIDARRIADATTPTVDATGVPDVAIVPDAPMSDAQMIDAPPPSTDPFDPGSCAGTAMSNARAAMLVGAGGRSAVATATLMVRNRSCAGSDADAGACGPWTTPTPFVQTLVTYSGGVTTHYKSFSFPMTLVLWDHGEPGTPSYGATVRQSDDYANSPTDDTRGVAYPFGVTSVDSPTIYVWDPSPDHPEDYQDLYTYFDGDGLFFAGDHCARFSIPIASGDEELAVLFTF